LKEGNKLKARKNLKALIFASRNFKEIIRDPVNLFFGLGFPLVILFLLSAIQSNIPIELFTIDQLTPGIAVFGLSFFSLFSGMLIAKDRTQSFLMRLFASPMTAKDFIFGYIIPFIPMALIQSMICFIAAMIFGLEMNLNVLLSILVLLPSSLLFIGIGLFVGSAFNDKQVGGICGPLLTNVSAWLSGIWFDLSLIGGTFEKIANLLPFSHAVEATRAALAGNIDVIMPHLIWVLIYATLMMGCAIYAFKKKMDG
jgi:ABC-2 type transport system permease protein